ncbi:MAG: hypothetical protein ACRCSK_06535, partial [Fusobacteriaceae bacterium]
MKNFLQVMVSIVVTFFIVFGLYFGFAIPKLFKLNSELKKEGYYVGEFEFKMLGFVSYLDNFKITKAYVEVDKFKNSMKLRELKKIPEFKNDQEKLEFFLSLQNPKTGAFMDESFPYFTYIAPTVNMIEYTKTLSLKINKPLKLKYELKFLEEINSPEKLTKYLNSVASTNFLLAKIKAPYVAGISELASYKIFETDNLYKFSPEWEATLKNWFINNQDSQTGFWGSKLTGNFKGGTDQDLASTFHVLKLFIDENGNILDKKFEPKYNDKLFASMLAKLKEPMPKNISNIHDWSLTRSQGIDVLARIIKYAGEKDRAEFKIVIENLLADRMENFYDMEAGAFSLYPNEKADMDGTGIALHLFKKSGVIDSDRKKIIFADELKNYKEFNFNEREKFLSYGKINSVRIVDYKKEV